MFSMNSSAEIKILSLICVLWVLILNFCSKLDLGGGGQVVPGLSDLPDAASLVPRTTGSHCCARQFGGFVWLLTGFQ